MRMLDLIRRGKLIFRPTDVMSPRTQIEIKRCLQTTVAIVADNVAEYILGQDRFAPDRGIDHYGQIPNVTPPWKNFFVEWVEPMPAARKEGRWSGVHFLRLDAEHLYTAVYLSDLDSRVVGPVVEHVFRHDEHGVVQGFRRLSSLWDKEFLTENASAIWAWHLVSMFAISLMHCRNVEISEAPIPAKLQKATIKRNHPPLVQYKVLKIEAMRKVIRKAVGAESKSELTAKALHICRGHFRTYKDRPMFGRVTGTFFIPQHVRGALESGVVVKDYELERVSI